MKWALPHSDGQQKTLSYEVSTQKQNSYYLFRCSNNFGFLKGSGGIIGITIHSTSTIF